jgi:hypothetical protein
MSIWTDDGQDLCETVLPKRQLGKVLTVSSVSSCRFGIGRKKILDLLRTANLDRFEILQGCHQWPDVQELFAAVSESSVISLTLMYSRLREMMLPQLCKLKELNLSNNQLDELSCRSLRQVLASSPIENLVLQGCRLKADVLQSLVCELESTSLTSLDLAQNCAGSVGARVLAGKLRDSKITALGLGSNAIGMSGLRSLLGTLPFTELKALDLSNNFITLGPARLLAQYCTTHLEQLDIRKNPVDPALLLDLAAAAEKGSLMKLLITYDNCRSEAAMTTLEQALDQKSQVLVLQMSLQSRDEQNFLVTARFISGSVAAVVRCPNKTLCYELPFLLQDTMIRTKSEKARKGPLKLLFPNNKVLHGRLLDSHHKLLNGDLDFSPVLQQFGMESVQSEISSVESSTGAKRVNSIMESINKKKRI